MKKGRTILVGLLLVLMTVGFSLNAVAQDNSENEKEIPEILQLNPSLDFDREAIKEWAEEHSWEEARSLAIESHVRKTEEDITETKSVRMYTPLLTWLAANYKGEQRFWSKEKIQEDYRSYLDKPKEGIYFLCHFMYFDRSVLNMGNFRFVLEDEKGKHWEAGESGNISLRQIRSRSVLGTTAYLGLIDLRFYFSEDKYPNWDQLTLYIIRTDQLVRTEFTWAFE